MVNRRLTVTLLLAFVVLGALVAYLFGYQPSADVANGLATIAFRQSANLVTFAGQGGGSVYGLASADFNNDTFLDLVVTKRVNAGEGTFVSVLPGLGNGKFGPATDVALPRQANGRPTGPAGVVAKDITGDGKADLLASAGELQQILVYAGQGDMTFAQPVAIASTLHPWRISLADVNGDGHDDLVGITDKQVQVFAGHGDGTFAPEVNYPVGDWQANDLALVDVDQHNGLDIVIGIYDPSRMGAFLNNGDGTFGPVKWSANLSYANLRSFIPGDFNEDGLMDVVPVGFSQTPLLLGNGDGTFRQTNYVIDPDGSPHRGHLTDNQPLDLNKDGHHDVAYVHTFDYRGAPNFLGVALGNGKGEFTQSAWAASPGSGTESGSVDGENLQNYLLADFSNDGALDAVTASESTNNRSGDASILLGNPQQPGKFLGVETLHQRLSWATGSVNDRGLQLGDVDNDGDQDAVILGQGVFVARGNGDGTFGAFQMALPRVFGQESYRDLKLVDFDSDGNLDVAFVSASIYDQDRGPGRMQIAYGTGDGTFGKSYTSLDRATATLSPIDRYRLPDFVACSSAVHSQCAAVTGATEQLSGEWASHEERLEAWVELKWNSPRAATGLYLEDRQNDYDHIQGGTLFFSDGSSQTVSELPNNGQRVTIDFPEPKTITTVMFRVDKVSHPDSGNIGLRRLGIITAASGEENIALTATPTCSKNGNCQGINDGRGEPFWRGQVGDSVELTWPSPQTVGRIRLAEEWHSDTRELSGRLTISDGTAAGTTVLPVTQLSYLGVGRTIVLPKAQQATSIKFTIDSFQGPEGRLSELEAYANQIDASLGRNLAYEAIPTCSSVFDNGYWHGSVYKYDCARAVDTVIRSREDDGWNGEWASNEKTDGSINLAWPSPVDVGRVALYNRTDPANQVTSGTVELEEVIDPPIEPVAASATNGLAVSLAKTDYLPGEAVEVRLKNTTASELTLTGCSLETLLTVTAQESATVVTAPPDPCPAETVPLAPLQPQEEVVTKWNGKTSQGVAAASGLYTLAVKAGEETINLEITVGYQTKTTTVAFGELPTDKTPLQVVLPNVSKALSLKVVVGTVSPSTTAAGFTEVEVYEQREIPGRASPAPGQFIATPPTNDTNPRGITTGDYNGDGYRDFASWNQIGQCQAEAEVFLFDPAQPRTFLRQPDRLPIGFTPWHNQEIHALTSADVNDDGKDDLLIGSNSISGCGQAEGHVLLYLSAGAGQFEPVVDYAPYWQLATIRDLALRDFDRDGRLDLVIANGNQVTIATGRSGGGFAKNQTNIDLGGSVQSLGLADLDGNQTMDIAATVQGKGVVSLQGAGDGTFVVGSRTAVGGTLRRALAIGSINQDTRPDLVVGHDGEKGNNVALLINESYAGAADLTVESVVGPEQVQTGQTVEIRYTVANRGGDDARGVWKDEIYLSLDDRLSADDTLVGAVNRQDPVLSQEAYAATWTGSVPPVMDGTYFWIVVADSGKVIKETREGNNAWASRTSATVSLPTVAIGETVTLEVAAGADRFVRLTVTGEADVRLTVSQPAVAVELVARLGAFPTNAMADAVGQTSSSGQIMTLTKTRPGTYYLKLTGREPLGGGQPVSVTASAVPLSVASFSPNRASNRGSITLAIEGGQLARDMTVEVVRTTPRPTVTSDPLDPLQTQLASAIQQLRADGTTYPAFETARQTAVQGLADQFRSYEEAVVSCTGIMPRPVVRGGPVRLEDTPDYREAALAWSVDLNDYVSQRQAAGVTLIDSTKAYAVVDLDQLCVGSYQVRLTSQGRTVTAPGELTITPGSPGKVEIQLHAPSDSRVGWENEATIEYRNTGESAVTAPVLAVGAYQPSPPPGRDIRMRGTAESPELEPTALIKLANQTDYTGSTALVLATNTDLTQGPAGVLNPGAGGRISFRYINLPGITESHLTIVNLSAAAADYNQNKLVRDLIAAAGPGQLPVSDEFVTQLNGFLPWNTGRHGDYQAMLAQKATELALLGDFTQDVNQLLSHEIDRSGLTDAIRRLRPGAFGIGVADPHQFLLEDHGTYLTVGYPDRGRVFDKKSDREYRGKGFDRAYVKKERSGAYVLQEIGGEQLAFTAAEPHRLESITDRFGQRFTQRWEGGRLTASRDPQGHETKYTYGADGVIQTVTDSYGQITRYESRSGRLTAIHTPNGLTTTISYRVTPLGELPETVTYPNQVSETVSYDDRLRPVRVRRSDGQEIMREYVPTGYLERTGALTEKFDFNSFGRFARVTDTLGRLTVYRYNPLGQLIGVSSPDEAAIFTYNDQGQVNAITDAVGHLTRLSYSSRGDLTSLSDSRGQKWTYQYTAEGALASITNSLGLNETYTYDAAGQLVKMVNRRGQAITFTYDNSGRLVRREMPGATVAYRYDARGNLTQYTDDMGTTALSYSPQNYLERVVFPNGQSLAYTYDAAGRRSSIIDQTGWQLSMSYDAAGRLAELADNGGHGVSYAYDALDRLIREVRANGTRTDYRYTAFGQVAGLTDIGPAGQLRAHTWDYDSQNRLVSTTGDDGDVTYSYDSLGQLVRANTGQESVTYQYDAAGNRTTATEGGQTVAYQTNGLNQYLSGSGQQFTYDPDGNLTKKVINGQTWQYEYNAANQLTRAVTPAGTFDYVYSGLGHLGRRTASGVTTSYQTDPVTSWLVGSVASDGQRRTYLTGDRGVAAEIRADESRYLHVNLIGSTEMITDQSGAAVERLGYQPFGGHTGSAFLAFGGLFGHQEDGTGLVYMQNRWYDPMLGRFTSLDPLGLAAGDTNLYRYVGNDPVGLADPFGLQQGGLTPGESLGSHHWEVKPPQRGPGRGIPLSRPAPASGPANPAPLTPIQNTAGRVGVNPLAQQGGTVASTEAAAVEEAAARQSAKLTEKVIANTARAARLAGRWFVITTIVGITEDILSRYDISPTQIAGRRSVSYDNTEYGPRTKVLQEKHADQDTANLIRKYCSEDSPLYSKNFCNFLRTKYGISADPNDLVGPTGVGDRRWLTADQTLPYLIHFENMPTATAAAQTVTITQTLDDDLDLSTFALTGFGFSAQRIAVPDGRQTFRTRIDDQAHSNVFVDVAIRLDTASRVMEAIFTSIDPATGKTLPEIRDATRGFLSPNDDTHRGEGYLSYVVRPKQDLANGTELTAQASIVFDTNEALATPRISNTIDTDRPTATVQPLAAETATSPFTVSWQGSDGGTGVANYDIYARVNDGDFQLWQSASQETKATYQGQVGRRYQFAAVARDLVGQTGSLPAAAQATIVVVRPPAPPTSSPSPSPTPTPATSPTSSPSLSRTLVPVVIVPEVLPRPSPTPSPLLMTPIPSSTPTVTSIALPVSTTTPPATMASSPSVTTPPAPIAVSVPTVTTTPTAADPTKSAVSLPNLVVSPTPTAQLAPVPLPRVAQGEVTRPAPVAGAVATIQATAETASQPTPKVLPEGTVSIEIPTVTVNQPIEVFVDDRAVATVIPATSDIRIDVPLPADLASGNHAVTVRGSDWDADLRFPVNVLGAREGKARPLILVFLVAGFVLAMVGLAYRRLFHSHRAA